MHLRACAAGILVASLTVPTAAGAQSIEQLQTQIASLLSQIAALEAQVKQAVPAQPQQGASATALACAFSRNLARGDRGADVTALQAFLRGQGLLAPDSVTGFFGALTERALMEWQTRRGIVSEGSPATTGWGALGPRTRAALNGACGGVTTAGALSAAPLSGSVPLTVRFTVTRGDNGTTRPSFLDGQDTLLDFGDGAEPLWVQCPGESGVCAVPMQVNHTYLTAGTYTVMLKRAGGLCAGECPETLLGSVRVQVNSATRPSCAITASSDSVNAGQVITLSWTTRNAVNALLATHEGSISVPLNGSRTVTVPVSGSVSYELAVTSANGYIASCRTSSGVSAAVQAAGTSFNAQPSSGSAPLDVLFTGFLDGAGYSVDFGDGTTSGDQGCAHGGCPVAGTSTVSVRHIYRSPGAYIAKLRRHFAVHEGNCAGADCNVVSSIVVQVR